MSRIAALAALAAGSIVAAVAVAAADAPAVAPPAADALVREVADAYRALPGYHDEGIVERATAGPGGSTTSDRFAFETLAAGGGVRFTLRDEAGAERVAWGDAAGGGILDRERGQYVETGSAVAALVGLLGPGGLEALAVPALLAGSAAALADPEDAAVEGPEPCPGGEGSCWVLALARDRGSVRSRLWIERSSRLILRVETELLPPESLAGMPAPSPAARGGVGTSFRVEHRPGPPPDPAEVAFAPPPEARRVERWEPVAGDSGRRQEAAPPEAAFGERVEVALRTLVVRALDRSGDPIPGLGPEDFRVVSGRGRGRRELPVVTAEWVGVAGPAGSPAAGAAGGLEPAAGAAGTRPPAARSGAPGRLVLFFVQADPQAIRLRGQLKQLPFARELLDALPAGDRVAVVSFDAHLKLWQDFTRDRDAVYDALERAVLFGGRPAGRPPDGPGFGARWDPRAAMAVATAERGLELTARALAGLPGEKAVVWLGWGLGRLDRGVVRPRQGYDEAVAALAAARASVFVLDITDAAYHSLEAGLLAIAEATGGTYAKTHTFAGQVTRRLARTLSGHYELTIDVSEYAGEIEAMLEDLTVELRGRPGTALLRPAAASTR
jgi:VWFA-related protein